MPGVTGPVAPRLPAYCGPVRTEARYTAVAARAGLGGDLYDVVDTAFGVRAIIGDVTGHGPEAAELAAGVGEAFRELARHEPTLAGITLRLDTHLTGRVGEIPERFATALLLQIPAGTGTAELVCCGHPAPMVLREGRVRYVHGFTPALPLGLLGFGDGRYATFTIPFDEGDALLLYTDGVSEARDPQGRFYPLAERVAGLPLDDPSAFLSRLEADLRAHAGRRPHDDVALLLLRLEPAGTRTG